MAPQARLAVTPTVDALVRDLYGSLLEDTSFRPCLRAVGPAFRSHITALHYEELLVRSGGLEMMGEIDGPEFQKMADDYALRWAGNNLWIERGIAQLLEQGYGAGEDSVGDRELVQSEYFQHFLRPVDIRHGLGINVQSDGVASLAILSINRSAIEGPFDACEMALVAALRPHLVNAFAICRRMDSLHDQARSLRAGFERNPLGMLVLDGEGRVVERNAEAARLLHDGPRLACSAGGLLHFGHPGAQARFRAAVLEFGDPGHAPTPVTIIADAGGESGPAGLALHLCAFPASSVPVLRQRGRILGFLCELSPHSEHKLGIGVLRAALDLTPMESEVVLCLRERHDPTHAAVQLGLAVSTVRSHLKHVFRKTGATGQGELLRLVDRLLSSLPH